MMECAYKDANVRKNRTPRVGRRLLVNDGDRRERTPWGNLIKTWEK